MFFAGAAATAASASPAVPAAAPGASVCFCLDSGVSQHLVADPTSTNILLANNGTTTAAGGEGAVPLTTMSAKRKPVDLVLTNALLMPGATINLLSVSRLAIAGHCLTMPALRCTCRVAS